MQAYLKHLKTSRQLRKLIKGTQISDQLYWYDQKLKNMLGWKGVFKFFKFSLASNKQDVIAGNYHVNRLYNGPRFRYHLGLDVPEPRKARIRVGKQWQYWETAKAFGFDDSFEHEVIHDGEQDRVVLIVDAWNPSLSEKEIQIFDNRLFHQFGAK